MGGLDLRQRESALKGGTRGPAIVPGNASQSLLYQAVLRSGPVQMPPGNKGLSPTDVAAIKSWIDSGATWTEGALSTEPAWWSFKKVRRPAVPANNAKNPIDAFIQAKLVEQKLSPVEKADRRALIRRATFDLLGLPPTAEEVSAFLGD